MIAVIFIGGALFAACAGLIIGLVAGANRAARDMQKLVEHHKVEIAQLDQENAEDVRRLRDEYESQIVKLNDAHRRDVVRQASALHKRECRNIAKRGKERGAVTGANA